MNSQIVQLAVLLFGICGSQTDAETIIFNETSVNTLEGVDFNGHVMEMIHNMEDDSLIVSDQHAIWRLNAVNNSKELIAGAPVRGYVEGTGSDARFNGPRGLILFQSKLVVSDGGNHCLRDIDLATRITSKLAGRCNGPFGFTDGQASQARFNYPAGILLYKSGILVADSSNNALRMLRDDAVSTIVRGNSQLIGPLYLEWVDGDVFITTLSGLLKLNQGSDAVELVAGSASEKGFTDGPLLSARFDSPTGLISPAPALILLADRNNYRIRLVDLRNGIVKSICTGEDTNKDGFGADCTLSAPRSLLLYDENTAYIGLQRAGLIRTMTLDSIKMDTDATTATTAAPTTSGRRITNRPGGCHNSASGSFATTVRTRIQFYIVLITPLHLITLFLHN